MTSLRSTYQPSPTPSQPPLPPGWTEHAAPTGHTYYYNTTTKSSTYTRPFAPPPSPQPQPPSDFIPFDPVNSHAAFNGFAPPQPFQHSLPNAISDRGPSNPKYQRRGPPLDRPRSKHDLPGCAPWILVKTRLGRRFVHNAETGVSQWKVPDYVKAGIEKFDAEEKKRRAQGGGEGTGANKVRVGERKTKGPGPESAQDASAGRVGDEERVLENIGGNLDEGEESYDEIIEEEVSASEDERDDNNLNKRPRLDSGGDDAEQDAQDDDAGALEFTEDDIAAQLAAMGQSCDLDPGEYGGQDETNGNEEIGQDLTTQEAESLFSNMLDDAGVNPYTTWEQLIGSDAGSRIIEDDRYTLLPNMRSRKAAFATWSSTAIEKQKEDNARKRKQDPRIEYLELLAKEASPKLYWPEFKKKFHKDAVMTNTRLSDKDREKLYREFNNRVKSKSSEERKDDLWDLLKSLPVSEDWDGDTSLSSLPQAITTDVRYAVLSHSRRERLIKEYMRRLPYVDEIENGVVSEKEREDRKERRRKEAALKEREREVLEQKRKAAGRNRAEREELLREEEELRRAERVGRSGLRDQLQDE